MFKTLLFIGLASFYTYAGAGEPCRRLSQGAINDITINPESGQPCYTIAFPKRLRSLAYFAQLPPSLRAVIQILNKDGIPFSNAKQDANGIITQIVDDPGNESTFRFVFENPTASAVKAAVTAVQLQGKATIVITVE